MSCIIAAEEEVDITLLLLLVITRTIQATDDWTYQRMKLELALVIGVSALFSQSLCWSSATTGRRRALSKRTFFQLGGATTEYVDEQWEADETRRKILTSSVVAALCASLPANAMDDIENKRIGIFEKASPSVVFIDTFTERRDAFSTNVMEVPLGSGSGFVWDDAGHIVTNYHVVRNAQSAQIAIVTADSGTGSSSMQPVNNAVLPYTSMRPTSALSKSGATRSVFKAKVVGVDPGKDIAVLRVDAPAELLKPLNLGTSADLRVGQSVLAIGNPFGLDHSLSSGIISGLGREVKSPIGRPITNVVQIDAAINPGNSGGPLLDSSGDLIGMNTAIYSPSGASAGVGFAIPIDSVKFIVETLLKDGKVIRPVLGISYLESKQARSLGIGPGVLVLEVPEGSPAALAGLKGTRRSETGLIEIGDIIMKVGTTVISTESDLFAALDDYKPGDNIDVAVSRVVAVSDELVMKQVVLTVELQASTIFEKKENLQVYQTQ